MLNRIERERERERERIMENKNSKWLRKGDDMKL